MDYANVLEAVATMVFEGRSLAGACDRIARQVLTQLQVYAEAFRRLCALCPQCFWRIEGESFIAEFPTNRVWVAFRYWDVRDDQSSAGPRFEAWCGRIADLLSESLTLFARQHPESFAA